MEVVRFIVEAAVFLFEHSCDRRRKIAVHTFCKALFDRIDIRCCKHSDCAARNKGKMLFFSDNVYHILAADGIAEQLLKCKLCCGFALFKAQVVFSCIDLCA